MTEDQQDQLVISLDTQYAVAHAIYNRFHANGHRCIARTNDDVVIDGRLELIRRLDGAATLRFQGIRSLAIYGKE